MPEALFIDRKRYFETFTRMLESPSDGPFILNLHGPGGMGKTKILEKIVKRCSHEGIPHTGIVDLYGFEMSSRLSAVEMKIADALKETGETDPMKTYREVRETYKSNPPHERGVEYKQQFITDLSAWAKRVAKTGKKAVLIFDTFEEVRYTLVGIRLLNDWFPELRSAVVIISGRQKPEEIDFPETIKGSVTHEEVSVFTEEEAIGYLEGRGVWDEIQKKQIQDELFDLSEKKPLLLALSADWMIDYEFFPAIDIGELVKGSDSGPESFEQKLVHRLPQLAGEGSGHEPPPEGPVLLAMAHIIEPLNEKMLPFLSFNDPENRKVMENLSKLSFIKGVPVDNPVAYWFQDELRSLFRKHVFGGKGAEIKDWKRTRVDLSERMIKYYEKLIEELKKASDEIAIERAEASKLFHEIFIDPEQGMKTFQKKFEDARDNHRYGFSSLLRSSVRFHLPKDLPEPLPKDLPETQEYHFMIQEGRWLRDMGAVKQAKERFDKLLRENPNDPKRTPYIYNALGATAMKMGQYQKALTYHQESLEWSKTQYP